MARYFRFAAAVLRAGFVGLGRFAGRRPRAEVRQFARQINGA